MCFQSSEGNKSNVQEAWLRGTVQIDMNQHYFQTRVTMAATKASLGVAGAPPRAPESTDPLLPLWKAYGYWSEVLSHDDKPS